MASYIIKKINEKLKNIDVLQQQNKFHEIEIRLGELKNFFSSNLGPDVFQTIFNKFMAGKQYDNEIILDWVFNNKAKFNF